MMRAPLPFRFLALSSAFFLGAETLRAATLTFDELPSQSVDGLHYQGVTFGFEIGGVPSADAAYNSFGPVDTVYLDELVLEGNAAGVLTFLFDEPAGQLSFAVALNASDVDAPSGVLIDLYDIHGAALDSFALDLFVSPGGQFPEALFSWSGPGVSRVTLDFNEFVADRFGVDNLTFEALVIPEPGTCVAGLAVGGMALAAWQRRRRA